MNKLLDVIKKTRYSLLEQINDLDEQQLNQIPDGFSNNITWNLGHMVSSQQGLCYLKGGLQPLLKEEFIAAFQPVVLHSVIIYKTLAKSTVFNPIATLFKFVLSIQYEEDKGR